MALVMLGIVFVGSSRTFYLRPFTGATDLSGSASLPAHLQIHGLILSAWYALFFLQPWLIATRRTSLHRRVGLGALIVAAGVVIASGLTVLRVVRDYRRYGKVFATTQWGAAAFVAAKAASVTLQATGAGVAFVGWLVQIAY